MIQPVLLHAFASTPVHVVLPRRAAENAPIAVAAKAADTTCPVDELNLSDEAQALAESPTIVGRELPGDLAAGDPAPGSDEVDAAAEKPGRKPPRQLDDDHSAETKHAGQTADASRLTEEEQQQVAELKSRDREVRSHEQAHLSAAGAYARGGAAFEYQDGPDGRQYAVGGEVSIDTSAVSGDPEATIQKARQIRAAALAPASPSSQDQSVAAAAAQMEAQARGELARREPSQRSAAASYRQAEEPGTVGRLLDLVA